MLDAIKENGIVMYSIFCMPKDKSSRKKLYNSGKDVHFAAENMTMNKELIETTFKIGEWSGTSKFRDAIAYLKQA